MLLTLFSNFAGQVDTIPRIVLMNTDNTKAEAETAGFLDVFLAQKSFALYTTDFVLLSAADGNDICVASFSNGVCTLTSLL